ncbi:prohibitin family protein [bacterium]|nr:prohibitin family protein [bacterium]
MGLLIFLIIVAVAISIFMGYKPGKSFWMNKEGKVMKNSVKGSLIGLIVILIVAISIVSSGIVIVHPGNVIIKFNKFSHKGNLSAMGQGFHIVFPFIYAFDKYNVRIQEYTMSVSKAEGKKYGDDSVWSPTKEGLQVGVDLTLWFRLDTNRIIELHKTIGRDYEEKIIRPAIRSLIRNTVSQYGVMELYSTKRAEVQEVIFQGIKKDLSNKGIIIDRLLLRDIAFPKEFQNAIEEKQIAQQQAQKMKYVLEKEQKEAERKRIEANGEAKKITIINEALRKSPNYIKYLYVDKLSDKIKVIVSDQSTIMDLKGLIGQ